jgi:DNA-binding PadR family transcriptional regulator
MIRGHLGLLLLAVLSGGPRHGYAVITELQSRSGGVFDLPEGTVYPALHTLEATGLVDSDWTVVDGRRRRLYALTAAGMAALLDQREEWGRFADGVTAVLAR